MICVRTAYQLQRQPRPKPLGLPFVSMSIRVPFGSPVLGKLTLTLLIGSAVVLPLSAAGASNNPFSAKSLEARAKAEVACNQAMASNKVVTAKTIKACNIANVPSVTACSHGPSVNQASLASDDVALLRVGHKPVFYVAATTENPNPVSVFDVSDITQLCGDPIDPTDTPAAPSLTQAQVKAAFKSCERTHQCLMKLPKQLGGG
jgi:hypothetical protein